MSLPPFAGPWSAAPGAPPALFPVKLVRVTLEFFLPRPGVCVFVRWVVALRDSLWLVRFFALPVVNVDCQLLAPATPESSLCASMGQ